jgi:hypothetical protein
MAALTQTLQKLDWSSQFSLQRVYCTTLGLHHGKMRVVGYGTTV